MKFEEGAYFNNEGIEVLLQLFIYAKAKDQKIAITGLSEHFKKIFHISDIDRFATIFNTEKEELENLGAAEA